VMSTETPVIQSSWLSQSLEIRRVILFLVAKPFRTPGFGQTTNHPARGFLPVEICLFVH
jgi:hypothetical protein